MKFFAAFVAFSSLVSAAPAANRALTSRQDLGVTVCVDANSQGPCTTFSVDSLDQCIPFPSDFDNDVSSFIPDAGLSCTIFVEPDCTGRSLGGTGSLGITDLNQISFDDVISSFKCGFVN
ncbi:hypothetical protein B0H14DRAFT_1085549 [Mycena olivaceomarginata]|nr:hypothetical protein B0H14DRAFT_1085549 [Mycena olivaceomarginata]